MDILYIVLRVLHIFGGIFWAGATTAFVLFVSPAAAQTAPESNKFMANLTTNQILPTWLSAAAGVNVLAGIILFWLDSGGLSAAWFNRAYALSFTVGALAGLAAFVLGIFFSRPRVERMGTLGKEIQSGGKPPTPEQIAEMRKLGGELVLYGRLTVVLLAITILGMVLARPLGFG